MFHCFSPPFSFHILMIEPLLAQGKGNSLEGCAPFSARVEDLAVESQGEETMSATV
jgi:hypothetical protein